MLNIGYLFDVDGFHINGDFLVKEMAIGDFETFEIKSYTYRVGNFANLSAENQRRVAWVTRHIHGLRFDNPPSAYSQSALHDHIDLMCMAAERKHKLIGYKGGHFELDLLTNLGYRHLAFNIENINCPKLESLLELYPDTKNYQCSNHLNIINKHRSVAHCPQMEVYCFMKFVDKLFKTQKQQIFTSSIQQHPPITYNPFRLKNN